MTVILWLQSREARNTLRFTLASKYNKRAKRAKHRNVTPFTPTRGSRGRSAPRGLGADPPYKSTMIKHKTIEQQKDAEYLAEPVRSEAEQGEATQRFISGLAKRLLVYLCVSNCIFARRSLGLGKRPVWSLIYIYISNSSVRARAKTAGWILMKFWHDLHLVARRCLLHVLKNLLQRGLTNRSNHRSDCHNSQTTCRMDTRSKVYYYNLHMTVLMSFFAKLCDWPMVSFDWPISHNFVTANQSTSWLKLCYRNSDMGILMSLFAK